MTTMNISDDPLLAALGEARAAARRAVAAGTPGGLLDGRAAVDTYRAALADCPLDRIALGALRGELMARLDRGLGFSGSDTAVGQLFSTLLDRLEVCEDLMDPREARRRFAAWEIQIADAQLAARASGRGA